MDTIKKYNSLPEIKEFIQNIKEGKNIVYNKLYEVRLGGIIDSVDSTRFKDSKLGRDWLKKVFYDSYYEHDPSKETEYTKDGFSYSIKRNNLDIDETFWKKHYKLLTEWGIKI